MTSKKVSQEQPASALTGAELVRIVQGGESRRTTLQAIADIATGATGATGPVDASALATLLHAASNKTTLVDADEVNGTDSAASFGLIRTTWGNVKAFLKTYFDTVYLALAGGKLTGALNWSATQTIASAATTDIGAATSNSVIVSGTTTITSLGTIAAGAERIVQFSGALTLTHNATSLILPGGTSITTAAGDVAYFVSLGSGNWRCTGYQKANGQAVVASGGSSNTRWLGAGEFIPHVTNSIWLEFDSGTQEFAQASFDWPSGYTTFTATFYWTAASGSGAVVWRAAARCYADDDALDQAFGTAQSVTDTLITAFNNHASSATSAVTPSGTVSAGNLCVVLIDRDAANVSDTLAVDAYLIGVRLVFA